MGRGAEPESAPIVIEKAWRGFDGVVFHPLVDFYTIQVSNPSDEPVAGEFWVEIGVASSARSRFQLSPGERKLLRISAPKWRHGADVPRLAPARVQFESEGRRVATEELQLEIPQMLRAVFRSEHWEHGLAQWVVVCGRAPLLERYVCDPGKMAGFARASAATLPVDPFGYLGSRGVLVSFDEFRSSSEAQWTALFEYLRLGGVVVIDGHSDPAEAAQFGPWADVLPLDESHLLRFVSAVLRLGRWNEGTDISILDPASKSRAVPLHVRHVGFGALFLLPEPVGTAGSAALPIDEWQEMLWRIPLSRFPFRVACLDAVAQGVIGRMSSVVCLGAAFVFYVALCSVLAWRSVARRAPRARFARKPLLVAVGLAAAACPLTGHWAKLRPSPAVHSEVSVVAAGSTRGVTLGAVHVASTGRGRHEISVGGGLPRAYPPWRARAEPRVGGGVCLGEGAGDDIVFLANLENPAGGRVLRMGSLKSSRSIIRLREFRLYEIEIDANAIPTRLPLAPIGTEPARYRLDHTMSPWTTASVEWIASCRLPGIIDGRVFEHRDALAYDLDLPEWVPLDDLAIIEVTDTNDVHVRRLGTTMLRRPLAEGRTRITGRLEAPSGSTILEELYEFSSYAPSRIAGYRAPEEYGPSMCFLRVRLRDGMSIGMACESPHLDFGATIESGTRDRVLLVELPRSP